ncbi:MAG: aromatic amino acid transaminase [Sphingomonadaceae bacterium]
MLERLNQQPPDALLALIKLFAADPRDDKIDLGVGVYKTDDGRTPVFRSIKHAEQALCAGQDSKAYLGPEGDMGFVHALMPHIFGDDPTRGGRIDGMQTPGGTGAVRLAMALAKKAGVARVFMGTPSWPNHAQILSDLDLEMLPFNHASDDGTANLDNVLAAIENGQASDAVLLHGCCHNPTGIDYTQDQWKAISSALADSPVMPVIDLAYQGLGNGMDEDAAGMRCVLDAVPEALVAYSCDKNFGLYRDRVGAFYIMARDTDSLNIALSNGASLARANWSMPPDHGAAAVRMVLENDSFTGEWLDELSEMRARIRQMRDYLAAAGTAGTVDLRPLASQYGMFAILPLGKEQILQLREDHGIYMAGSGRINIAGLHMGNIDKFIGALKQVTG